MKKRELEYSCKRLKGGQTGKTIRNIYALNHRKLWLLFFFLTPAKKKCTITYEHLSL